MTSQRGSFALGLIVGLLAGLALALGVALYITKVPVPFVNKVPHRSAEQDAAETARNKDWDPNAPLAGKNPARPAVAPVAPASSPADHMPPPDSATASGPALAAPKASAAQATASAASSARATRDPAAILAGKPASAPAATPATARSTAGAADAFVYFVQVGAYSRADDAEQQRARLAMLGLDARVTEREQSGRTVFRVRLGPFERRDDAESAQGRLAEASVEAALVRVDR